MSNPFVRHWVAAVVAAVVAAACAATPSEPRVTVLATPSDALTPAPSPTGFEPADVESLAWADILDARRVFGQYTIKPYGDRSDYLDVIVNRASVGRVESRAYSDFELLGVGYVPTQEGLRSLTRRYVDQNRALHLADLPGGTFEAIGPVEFAFANADGVKLGWTFSDEGRVIDRFVFYLVAIPGGVAWFHAAYDPSDVRQGGFPEDRNLLDFMASLDEVMAGVRIPLATSR